MLDGRSLLDEFRASFGGSPRLFSAPGRVNLLGEHTDYMGGYCLPIAVQRGVLVAAGPREDRVLHVRSRALGTVELSLDALGSANDGAWHDLILGIAAVLRRKGVPLGGTNLLIDSDLPIGGGLSSSAAVGVATGQALTALSNVRLGALELSAVVQAAENEFVGTRSGLLDPLAITSGRKGHAVFIDCNAVATSLVPFGDGASVLVFDTCTKRELAGSAYNGRRSECEAGLAVLRDSLPGVSTLRDVDAEALARVSHRMSPELHRRVRHVVLENRRVLDAVEFLRRGAVRSFGALMFDSHRSLAADYAVSTAPLDWVVSAAAAMPGVFGAKMTGGGFGGCVVVLVGAGSLAKVERELGRRYEERFGIPGDAYAVLPSDGACEVPISDFY